MITYILNPAGFSATTYGILFFLKLGALFILETVLSYCIRRYSKPTPFRVNHPEVKGLEHLERIDQIYLTINSVVEFVYINHIFLFIYNCKHVAWNFNEITLINGPLAILVVFVFGDSIYALAHRFMHWPPFYPYVHKHHHRQVVPNRGYLDAANEHPIEQVIGLTTLLLSYAIVSRVCGFHISAVAFHFIAYGILSLTNHSGYDISFSFLGLEYSVRAHEMHHRLGKVNMGQHFMVMDRLMGTYKAYKP